MVVVRYLRSQSSSADEDSSVGISPMADPWSAACVHDIATLCNATLDWQSLQLCLASNSAQLSSSCMRAFIEEIVKIQLQLANGKDPKQPPNGRDGIPALDNEGKSPQDVSLYDSDGIKDGSSGHGPQPAAGNDQTKNRGSPGHDQPRVQSSGNKGGASRGHGGRDPKLDGDSGHGKKDYELSGSTALQGSSGSLASHSSPHKSEGVATQDSQDHHGHCGGVHPLFWIFVFPFFCVGVFVSAKKALAYIKEQRMGGGRRPVESAEEYEPLQRS